MDEQCIMGAAYRISGRMGNDCHSSSNTVRVVVDASPPLSGRPRCDGVSRLIEEEALVADAETEQSGNVAVPSLCIAMQSGEDAHGSLPINGSHLGLDVRREAKLLHVLSASECST